MALVLGRSGCRSWTSSSRWQGGARTSAGADPSGRGPGVPLAGVRQRPRPRWGPGMTDTAARWMRGTGVRLQIGNSFQTGDFVVGAVETAPGADGVDLFEGALELPAPGTGQLGERGLGAVEPPADDVHRVAELLPLAREAAEALEDLVGRPVEHERVDGLAHDRQHGEQRER